MAIAERIGALSQRFTAFKAVPKETRPDLIVNPIQYTGDETERLLEMYWNNRSLVDGSSKPQGDILGILEIQTLFLKMLGLEHLTWGKRSPHRIGSVRTVTQKDIDILRERYKAVHRFSLQNRIEDRIWSKDSLNAQEARMYGQMHTLEGVLKRLGQTDFIMATNGELQSKP